MWAPRHGTRIPDLFQQPPCFLSHASALVLIHFLLSILPQGHLAIQSEFLDPAKNVYIVGWAQSQTREQTRFAKKKKKKTEKPASFLVLSQLTGVDDATVAKIA